MLGLGRLLEKQDKKVSYFTPTPVSRMYDFLPNVSKIKTKFDYKNYDLLVFVDLSSYGRITPFTEDIRYFDTKNIIIFDHHPENTPAHSLSYKDTQVASSAEVILEYSAKPRKKYFDKEIATYLYM